MQQTDVRTPVTIASIIWSTLAWILAVLLAVLFTAAGGAKLVSAPAMVQEFAQIGMGQWFRYVTGILEVSGAIGVLIPKLRFWASLQLATVMVGATVINLAILHLPGTARVTVVLMGLALTLTWLRRPRPRQQPRGANAPWP
jgi:putative oxidoreductase